MTTTTRIFAAQTERAEATYCVGTPEYHAAIATPKTGMLVIGEIEGDKARGVSAEVPAQLLAAPGVDFVLVEADGSRMLPAKAPAEHEPVISPETTLHIAVAGIDALAGTIGETCHRPDRVAQLLGLEVGESMSPADLAHLLCHANGGAKGAPAGARFAVMINKVEDSEQWRLARALARLASVDPRVERVVLGAIEPRGEANSETPLGFEIWTTPAPSQ